MKTILSEKNLVVLLFVMVLITFSLAHEDTKKMEHLYNGVSSSASATIDKLKKPDVKIVPPNATIAVIPSAQ
jgi:archaellum component FlaG (FlaF/FlaG flagellin family)